MQQKIILKLLPSQATDDEHIRRQIAASAGKPLSSLSGFHILKKSIDARGKSVYFNLQVTAFFNEPLIPVANNPFLFKNVATARHRVIIIGAGPAGLFAALKLIEAGIQPIIIERGKDVRARRRDLAILNKEGIVNPESNYCFGEGGAGTYSDGKLYTRSNKRGNINRILQLFVQFGAPENILYDAHPHIGTNKLPHIITAMRQAILEAGGQVLFQTKLTDISLEQNQIASITTAEGEKIKADAYLLATGHSARDIFTLLHKKNLQIEAKPFALGVRIEHPQALIDSIQYHCPVRDELLPPASYSLVQQVNNKGVFSFCMCPGGIIAPAATAPGELVVNGWSPSKRNNPFANSGMVVQVEQEDALGWLRGFRGLEGLGGLEGLEGLGGLEGLEGLEGLDAGHPLLMMYFQQMVERKSYTAGGGNFVAPAQRVVDFVNKKVSSTLPAHSYLPGLQSTELTTVLPAFIAQSLAGALKAFGKKLKGYYTNEAILVATESRTSSPLKIPRDTEGLNHPQAQNLYPCAEGAGYAGGIVSAAMDGERVADVIAQKLKATKPG